LKTTLFGLPALDESLDRWLGGSSDGVLRRMARERLYFWLLPERRVRLSPFSWPAPPPTTRAIRLLTLVPPEDTGGGSRPAQLAAELHRRGWSIDWQYALPIFPWPRRRRPAIDGVAVRHVTERAGDPMEADARPARGGSSPAASSITPPVLIEAPHPALCALVRALAPRTPVIYDAIDLWDGTLGAGWYSAEAERWLLERAQRLVASSALLAHDLGARTGRGVECLPNAVDRHLFDPRQEWPRPPDVRPGTPTVGYVGALWGEWLDLALVAAVADALPRATFHLVGRTAGRPPFARRNVHWLGVKPQSAIPAYLRSFDVTIVPFTASRLTAAVSPLKVFESLAMERPVVSTPMPELESVPGVTIAQEASAFAAAIERAAQTKLDPMVSSFVAGHTWTRRVDRLLDIVDTLQAELAQGH